MSWHPNDLVTDGDLRDYEASVLTSFGQTTWHSKLTKALEDWLFPILRGRGFDPYRLQTRVEASQVWSLTSAVYTDQTSVSRNTTADDLNLATVFATPGTDALYVGSTQPFRGVYVRVDDAVSSAAGVLSVAYWNGSWQGLTVDDATVKTTGKTLSGGGAVRWGLPMDWTPRIVNASDPLYWAKVTVSATPTGATAGQVAVIRSSALRAPVAFWTLALIFREAPTGQEGPWIEKALDYEQKADMALSRALPLLGGEFDTDASGQISDTEAAQTSDEVGGVPWALERA